MILLNGEEKSKSIEVLRELLVGAKQKTIRRSNMVLEFKRIPALKDKEHDSHELRWYRGSRTRP